MLEEDQLHEKSWFEQASDLEVEFLLSCLKESLTATLICKFYLFVWPVKSSLVEQQQLWFQKDGAPAHFSCIVRQ